MTLEQMQANLSLNKIPNCFFEIYEKIKYTYQERANLILSASFIENNLLKHHILTQYQELIQTAAEKIKNNPSLCLLLCLVEEYVKMGGNTCSDEYTEPKGEGIEYDFFHLFPAIPTIKSSIAYLKNRNVPDKVIYDTMREYDTCVQTCCSTLGRPAFDKGRLGWIKILIHNSLIRIGRLKYEIPQKRNTLFIKVYQNKEGMLAVFADGVSVHKDGMILGAPGFEKKEGSFYTECSETNTFIIGHLVKNGLIENKKTTFHKKDWKLILSKDDPVINIHIPSDGKFDQETIEQSFKQAREIFNHCYPDYPYKAFYCASWLMSVSLQTLLKPTSNILNFQKNFTLFPYPAYGTGVFQFVFPKQGIPDDYNTLPEDTSLQRAVKETYLQGNYINEFSGFFI